MRFDTAIGKWVGGPMLQNAYCAAGCKPSAGSVRGHAGFKGLCGASALRVLLKTIYERAGHALTAVARWTCTADRWIGNGIFRSDAWQVRR